MAVDYTTYQLSKKEKIQFLVVGYTIAFTVIFLFYHSIIFSAAGLLFVHLLYPYYQKQLAEKRKNILTIQFKDLLYSLSASIATNRQIPEALEEAYDNLTLIYCDDDPIILELRHINKRITENRESDVYLLIDLAKRSGCEDISNFVQVYMTCRTMGGDLEKVLSNAITILIDKMSIEREIKTLTAQKRFEGKMISMMPIMIILFLNLFSPEYLMPLYTTGIGRVIMTVAIAGIGGAYFMTNKLTNIEV